MRWHQKRHERGVERDRSERVRAHSDLLAVVVRSDDRHAGGEIAHHISKRQLIDRSVAKRCRLVVVSHRPSLSLLAPSCNRRPLVGAPTVRPHAIGATSSPRALPGSPRSGSEGQPENSAIWRWSPLVSHLGLGAALDSRIDLGVGDECWHEILDELCPIRFLG